MDQFNFLRSIVANFNEAIVQVRDSILSNLNDAIVQVKDSIFACVDGEPIDGTGTPVVSKLSAVQYFYVKLNAVTAICSPRVLWAVYAALILVLITRLAPVVDLILSYVGDLAYILLASTLSLKDVLLLVATASLTFKIFVDRPDQPILNSAPVSAAKDSAPGTRPSCVYCNKQGHTLNTCYCRRADLLSQLTSIERELERKAAAKASQRPVALDTSSQGNPSTVSNRRIQKALKENASASPQPDAGSSAVSAPRTNGPAVYVDTGAFFSKPVRAWVPPPPANYFY